MKNGLLELKRKLFAKIKLKIFLARGQYQKAKQQVNDIMKTWPEDLEILSLSQDAYRSIEDWEAYFSIYTHVLKLDPANLQIRMNYGTALFRFCRYEDATLQFLYCLEHWSYGENYNNALKNLKARLAICYDYLGQTEAAGILLGEMEGSELSDIDVLYSFLLHIINTNPYKISSFLDEQIRLSPNTYVLYFWKGLYVQYYLHDADSALSLFDKALQKINSATLKRAFYLGNLIFIDPEDIVRRTIKLYIKAEKTLEANMRLFMMKAKLLKEFNFHIEKLYLDFWSGDLLRVENGVKKELRRKMSASQESEYYLLLANIQLEKKDFIACAKSVSKVLMLDNISVEALKILGRLQMNNNNWRECLNTYIRLTTIEPFNFLNWKNLGYSYIQLGDNVLAMNSYKKVLDLNPFDANTWINLAVLYAELGDKTSALTAIENGMKYEWISFDEKEVARNLYNKLKVQPLN